MAAVCNGVSPFEFRFEIFLKSRSSAGDAEIRPKFELSSGTLLCCRRLEGVEAGFGPLTTCSGALGGESSNESENKNGMN